MDEAAALSALEGSTPMGGDTAEPVVNQAPTGTQPTEVSTESFTSVDRNSLPPELQSVWDSMNKDYTQKSQAVAEYRKLFADVEDPQQIRDAYDFWTNVNSDVDYAKQVYADLGEALKPYMESLETPAPVENSPIDDSVDPRLEALETKLRQFEEQQRFAAGAAELQRQEMLLRTQFKDDGWSDNDMEVAYEIAASMDGDLKAAGERWHQLKSDVIAEYLSTKASVGGALAPAPAGANAIQRTEITDTNDAHKAAVEYLTNALANGE